LVQTETDRYITVTFPFRRQINCDRSELGQKHAVTEQRFLTPFSNFMSDVAFSEYCSLKSCG